MRIDWNVVGICAAVVFCGMLLLKPLCCGFERLKSLPRELLVLFLSFAIIAAVEADKTNSTTRALMRQLVGLPAMVTQEEIARGYRLGYVTNDAGHSSAMPTNAVYLGNAHIRGAASGFGRNRLDFGEWSFPFGSNDTSYSSIWWFHDGRIRMSPRDPSGEISSGASNVIAVQGAVASFYGVPMRMAKLGNFLAGYGTEFLGVWGVSQWLSQGIGTSNDETASMSWDAGTLVASGTGVVTVAASLSTNMWDHADVKVRRLWPNHVPTDNHAVFSSSFDFNRNFCSPGVVEGRVR